MQELLAEVVRVGKILVPILAGIGLLALLAWLDVRRQRAKKVDVVVTIGPLTAELGQEVVLTHPVNGCPESHLFKVVKTSWHQDGRATVSLKQLKGNHRVTLQAGGR